MSEQWKWFKQFIAEDKWRPYDWGAPADARDILMWTRPSPLCAVDAVKASLELGCSVEDGLRLALSTDAAEVRVWDPEIDTLAVHKRIDADLYVALSSYRLPWPLYPRRFLTAQAVFVRAPS